MTRCSVCFFSNKDPGLAGQGCPDCDGGWLYDDEGAEQDDQWYDYEAEKFCSVCSTAWTCSNDQALGATCPKGHAW